jgi:hypothetical protein
MIDNIEWHGLDGAYGTPYKCYCRLCIENRKEYMNTTDEEDVQNKINMTIKVLKEQVKVFKDRIQPTETGHLHTAISVVSHRISELEQEQKEINNENSD